MSTYMENIYNNNENNNFQSTYNSIINELINLENLTPDKSRATFLESIFKQLCTVTNSSAAFIFELFNKNIYELKFKYLKNGYHLSDTLPDIFSAETIPDWHSRLSTRQIIIETDIKDSPTAMTDENNKLLNAGINSVIAFPISYAGNLLGYIRLDAPSFPISPFHLMLMRTIGMHLGSIWQNIDKDFLLMQRQDIINENKSELEKEKQFLDVLCRDYTSVYYVDLEKNTLELLKLDRIANAANFIPVENPKPLDYTEKDKNGAVKRRDYRSGEVKKGEPERLKVKTLGVDGFILGKQNVDLRYIEQLIDSEQTAALGLLLKYTVEHLVDGKRTISETAQWLEQKLEQEGMVFAAERGVISGGYAIPRIQEIYSCLNRYRV